MIALLLVALAVAAPSVTGVEVTSLHLLPSPRPEQFLTDLVGQPLSRDRVRASLDRLWALGVFDRVEVEEIEEPGGIRLRYRVTRRPLLEQLDWTGDLGLAAPDLAATAALALGGPADPERLARARTEVLARLNREGYLGATVNLQVSDNPATNGRAVTFVIAAGAQAHVRHVKITGLVHAEAKPLYKALDLDDGDRFRERALHDGVRAVEDRLHQDGFFEARVTAREPAWNLPRTRSTSRYRSWRVRTRPWSSGTGRRSRRRRCASASPSPMPGSWTRSRCAPAPSSSSAPIATTATPTLT